MTNKTFRQLSDEAAAYQRANGVPELTDEEAEAIALQMAGRQVLSWKDVAIRAFIEDTGLSTWKDLPLAQLQELEAGYAASMEDES